MTFLTFGAGLVPEFPSPIETVDSQDRGTEEAAVEAPPGRALAITPLVGEGDVVAQGAAVACLREAPDICLVAPIPGRIARVSLRPGRRLSEIVLFREDGAGAHRHDVSGAGPGTAATNAPTPDALRRLLQAAGAWPWINRRPFGGMPKADETPAALFVMMADTRPYAPDPAAALDGRAEAFGAGLTALRRLTRAPIFVVAPQASRSAAIPQAADGVQILRRGARHPQGSAGICIHGAFPAGLDAPVWDIHAEDVANIGAALTTGRLPMHRTLRIAGAGLRAGLRLRTHPGADLREITQRLVAPGPHEVLSGAHLDGRPARWLGPRCRQVTVLPRAAPARTPHWLVAALSGSARPRPAIPTAALRQSLGAAIPAAPFLRALGAGDEEAAMALGALSLLEEDLALTDYVLGAGGEILQQFRVLLDRIETEYAA